MFKKKFDEAVEKEVEKRMEKFWEERYRDDRVRNLEKRLDRLERTLSPTGGEVTCKLEDFE